MNNDSNVNAPCERIDTVFYFVDDLPYEGDGGYIDMCRKGKIDLRTIVFARKQRAIYKGGDMYCPMEDETFKSILLRLLSDDDVIDALIEFIKNHRGNLPIASTTELGVIMVGAFLAIAEDGKLSVDINALFDDPDVINKIKTIIKNWFDGIDPSSLPLASKSKYGVVKIGDGIDVIDGVISVNINDLSTDLEEAVLNFIRNNSNFRAGYDRYGVVKIKQNGGIKHTDGQIEVDIDQIKNQIGTSLNTDQSVESLTLSGSELQLRQKGSSVGQPIRVNLGALIPNTDNIGKASYTNFGVVRIKSDGGIIVQDGVISIDPDYKPEPGEDTGGKTIKSIEYYYLATSQSSGVTRSTSGWTTSVQQPTSEKRYLWQYIKYTYSDDTTYETDPAIISIYNDGSSVPPEYDPNTIINNTINKIQYQIDLENNYWNDWVSTQINQAIQTLVNDINNQNWNELIHSNGWVEALNAYMTKVGLLNVEQTEDGTVITDKYSLLLQLLDLIEQRVESIKSFFDEDGHLYSLVDAMALISTQIVEDGDFKQSVTELINSYISTEYGDVAEVKSAISALQKSAGATAKGLEATTNLITRVDTGSNITLNALKQISNESAASTSVSSSYSIYEKDEAGNYIYAVDDNGDRAWELDAQGHKIPYTTIQLSYITEDGTITTDKNLARTKKNKTLVVDDNGLPILDANNQLQWEETIAYGADNEPLLDMFAEVKYFAADPDTGDYTPTIWTGYVPTEITYDGYGFIDGMGENTIAYHRARKRKIISLADFELEADENKALAALVANYDKWGSNTSAGLTERVDALGASIGQMAKATFYETKIEDDVVKVKYIDSDNVVHWVKDGDTVDSTWTKVIKDEALSTVLSYVSNSEAVTSIQAQLDGVNASIDAVVKKNGDTIESGVYINADQLKFSANQIGFNESITFDSSGNASFKGIITATGGTIGGFTINSNSLFAESTYSYRGYSSTQKILIQPNWIQFVDTSNTNRSIVMNAGLLQLGNGSWFSALGDAQVQGRASLRTLNVGDNSLRMGAGTASMPSSPEIGDVVFAKGTGGNLTLSGNGYNFMNPDDSSTKSECACGTQSMIFVFSGSSWIIYRCI